jgi:PhoH-like ATPase
MLTIIVPPATKRPGGFTSHEMKTIITREVEGIKGVFIKGPCIDWRSNGRTCLLDRMKGQSIYAPITLQKGVRSTTMS